jgi:hypothetical protein
MAKFGLNHTTDSVVKDVQIISNEEKKAALRSGRLCFWPTGQLFRVE